MLLTLLLISDLCSRRQEVKVGESANVHSYKKLNVELQSFLLQINAMQCTYRVDPSTHRVLLSTRAEYFESFGICISQ